jgi:hypothetical protein
VTGAKSRVKGMGGTDWVGKVTSPQLPSGAGRHKLTVVSEDCFLTTVRTQPLLFNDFISPAPSSDDCTSVAKRGHESAQQQTQRHFHSGNACEIASTAPAKPGEAPIADA